MIEHLDCLCKVYTCCYCGEWMLLLEDRGKGYDDYFNDFDVMGLKKIDFSPPSCASLFLFFWFTCLIIDSCVV